MLLVGIFVILATAALRLGAGLLLPIALAGLATLLLDPPVRALRRLGLPTSIGAAVVVFGTVGLLTAGGIMLSGPAADWIARAPKTLGQVQAKVEWMLRPIRETAQEVDRATAPAVDTGHGTPTVQIEAPGVFQRLSVSTTSAIVTVPTVVFLTYFLLAMLPRFRMKLAELFGTLGGARYTEEVLGEMESQMSRYLVLTTLTRAAVGLATWGLLAALGLPGALLWGVVSFFLSFIPYAGALLATVLIGVAAIVAFDDTGRVFLVVGGSAAIHMLEGNFVTPHLMGRHLPLNPVAIFLCLLYWGWVWGLAGALMAVPLTVMLQVIFARVDALRPIASLLDS